MVTDDNKGRNYKDFRSDDSMSMYFNFDEGILEKVLSECCEPYGISTTWVIECILETALNNPDFIEHVATRHGWGNVNDVHY